MPRNTKFKATIMGVEVDVTLTIAKTLVATFKYTMHGSPQEFKVTKWTGGGFHKFCLLFMNASARNAAQFGSLITATDGKPRFQMDKMQKLNVIEQGVKDILTCVDQIARHYKRSILDYAVWYRENQLALDTYQQYITRLACCAIVHVNFLAPDISWPIVEFAMPEGN